jgi:hypothetical protein
MKIKKAPKAPERIKMKTRMAADGTNGAALLQEWWKAKSDVELAQQLCGTLAYLKTCQTYRMRQLAVDIRLYCGLSVYSYAGSSVSKMDKTRTLPDDRPTFNTVQVAVDTLVSRVGQNKPDPKFLTDGGDYKERHIAQECNQFVEGEFYRTKARQKIKKMFRDGLIMGASALKAYRGPDDKVWVDRVMQTDLFTDDNDALNGDPQAMYQMKLVDRDRLLADNRDKRAIIAETPQSYPDNSPDSGRTTTDQVMVVEGWKLPNGPDPEAPGYVPGRHTLATMAGVIFDEEWHKTKFPFVFFNYSDPFLGFWGQGIATRLFGTQMTLNRILYTIAQAIMMNGRPVWIVDNQAGIPSTHINNQIGIILKPKGGINSIRCETPPCNAAELYTERDKLIMYALRQEGISDMQATGQKPVGLNSGEAIRSADDISSDRFNETSEKYDQVHIDLAYLVTDVAMDIAKDTGSYSTVYPNKDGTKEIDLPDMSLLKNTYVIQCFNESSLPRTPAGRIATVTEQVQAGMLTIKEGRRLMRFPDLEQDEKLDNASEERIFQCLDNIVKDGKYTQPDPFMDLQLAQQLAVKYINLYRSAKLEQAKDDLLVKFFNVAVALAGQGQPTMPAGPAAQPQANPEPTPTSPLVPNTPGMAQAA